MIPQVTVFKTYRETRVLGRATLDELVNDNLGVDVLLRLDRNWYYVPAEIIAQLIFPEEDNRAEDRV